jgi:hypothetical protein
MILAHMKDFCESNWSYLPGFERFWIARFLQLVPGSSQNVKVFLKFSTFIYIYISGLQPNLVKLSSG